MSNYLSVNIQLHTKASVVWDSSCNMEVMKILLIVLVASAFVGGNVNLENHYSNIYGDLSYKIYVLG